MTRVAILSIVAALPVWRAGGQTAPPAPAFEVADIKPSAAGGDVRPGKERLLPGGRIELPHGTLKEFLIGAYGVQPDMIVGGPKWIDTDRFDIVAKMSNPDTPPPTMLLMLRRLLEERFKLVTHREEKMMPAYTLRVGKDGHKLRPPADAGGRQSCSTQPVGGRDRVLHRECRNMSVDELARQLGMGYGLEGQVVNETGLAGVWDLGFDFAPVRPAGAELPAATDGPTIFQSMNQLGLTLQPGKRALSVIVIDRAEKPGEN